MRRLFVATVPPPDVRRLLLGIMGGVEGARWQGDGQLHVTLRFIGDVEGVEAERIADLLSRLSLSPVDTAMCGVGYFEKRGQAHTLWAGLAPQAPLDALHQKIDRALVSIGLAREQRAYCPHATLARLSRPVAALAPFLQQHARLASPSFTVDAVSLYESLPSPDGRIYRPVVACPRR